MAMDCQTNLMANQRPLHRSWRTWTTTTMVSSTRWKQPVEQTRSMQLPSQTILMATSNVMSTTSISTATQCSTMLMLSHGTPAHPPTPTATACPTQSQGNRPSPKTSMTITTAGPMLTKLHAAATPSLQASCRSMRTATVSATQSPLMTTATPTQTKKRHNVAPILSMQQASLQTLTTTQFVTLSMMTWMATELQTPTICTHATPASTKMSPAAPTPHRSILMPRQTSMMEHA